MSTKEIVQAIKSAPEYKEAKKRGIDVEEVLETAMESKRFRKYLSNQTRMAILKAALNSAGIQNLTEDQSPFDEQLLLFGGSDHWGTKRPVNIVAMRKNGELITVSIWDAELLQMPCKARVVGIYDAKWNSITPQKDGGFLDVSDVTLASCQKMLQKIALNPENSRDWGKIDDMERYALYAFTGRVQWMNGTPIFNDDSQLVGANPLVCTDGHQPPKKHVTFTLALNPANSGYNVGLQVLRQRVGKPVISIPDLEMACFDAVDEHPGDVKSQCKFVRDVVYDRQIIAVGQMSSIKEKENKDGNTVLYANLTCGFIMEVDSAVSELINRETIVDEKSVEAPVYEMSRQRVKEMREGKQKKENNTENEEQRIISALVQSAHTLGVNPSEMPVDKVKSITSPDAAIDDAMLEQLKVVAASKYEAQLAQESGISGLVERFVVFCIDGGGNISTKPAANLRRLFSIPESVSDDEILRLRGEAVEKVNEIKGAE